MMPGMMPEAVKEQVAAGFAEVAADYDTIGGEFFRDMACRLVDQADVYPGAHVLDVGCGKGAVTIPAARMAGPGGCVHGIDLATAMLDQASACARQAALDQVVFEYGDAEDPCGHTSPFDVILAGYVIQFLPRPARALRAWLSLLRPGGTAGFSWGLAPDPQWAPVMAAVDAYLPEGIAGFDQFFRRPPFNGIEPVEKLLTSTGYVSGETTIHDVETVYRSPGEWWQACQSQAPWAVSWRHIPAAGIPLARAEAFRVLAGIQGSDGGLHRVLRFACTTAHRPGPR